MSDLVLVVNAGSSSLKYSLVDAATGDEPADGIVEAIGEDRGALTHRGPNGQHEEKRTFADHEDALRAALEKKV